MNANILMPIRYLGGIFIWGLITFGIIFLHLWVIDANYAALVQSFELLGFDQKPLHEDPFLGRFFEAFGLGDATQCHFYAGGLAMMLALGFDIIAYYTINSIRLLSERKMYQNNGDTESERQAEMALKYNNLLYLFILLPIVGVLVWWDLNLFNYRVLAGIYQIETVNDAAMMPKLGVSIADAPDNFALALNKLGGWGYLAVTLLTAFLMKITWTNTKENTISFLSDLLDLTVGSGQSNNVLETVMTQAQETVNPATTQTQESQPQETTTPTTAVSNNDHQELADSEAILTNATAENETSHIPMPVQQETQQQNETVDVLGEGNVKMSVILASPGRYFKDSDGRYWIREYYETVHSVSDVAVTETPKDAA